MPYDLHDTIAALASAPGGGARGIVRLSGPRVADGLGQCFVPDAAREFRATRSHRRWPGVVRVGGTRGGRPFSLRGHLHYWPREQSYTRQPSAEFHCAGSPPLLAAVVDELCRCGARPAEPGEFTLRAFVAGRLDLVQAEAVLGVIDARTSDQLDGALDQLAGGLTRPLHELRERLLAMLAELEAGLDFADEPIEFIARTELRERMARGARIVAAALNQLATRDCSSDVPRVALVGLPNAGKSSLFNALVERYGCGVASRSIVSPIAGATRDYVSAALDLDGLRCELIDAAGIDAPDAGGIRDAAERAATRQRRQADAVLHCVDAASPRAEWLSREFECPALVVATKADLRRSAAVPSRLACSSVTGEGLQQLAAELRHRLGATGAGRMAATAATAARCTRSLRDAERALAAAAALVDSGADELLSAEIRAALTAVGEVVGAVGADDVLDRVFSQFCIGK